MHSPTNRSQIPRLATGTDVLLCSVLVLQWMGAYVQPALVQAHHRYGELLDSMDERVGLAL